MSFFPKLLIVPISEAIDLFRLNAGVGRHVARNDLRVLEPGAGNVRRCRCVGPVVHRAAVSSTERRSAEQPEALWAAPHAFYKPAFVTLTPALSISFWGAVAACSTALADTTRRLYTGHGQTYTFYVLSYFVSTRHAVAFVNPQATKTVLTWVRNPYGAPKAPNGAGHLQGRARALYNRLDHGRLRNKD